MGNMMDTHLVNELREQVQPAVLQLIALAAERELSSLAICQGGLEISVERRPGPLASAVAPTPSAAVAQEDEHHRMVPVLSTLVGIFKTRSATEKAPVAEVGARVESGQVLGYIESMRLTYEIHAPSPGRLAEILVEEGHPVEYAQPLLVLEADE
jgi:acetyl-CoA carboxylase biotin carboxyl carrier protein